MPPDTISGFAAPVLLLKATIKKQIWIPQFTKKNGQVVGGHYSMVHVTDDHDVHKVASGQGTHSQKKAHGALADDAGFHGLPAEDQAALVMHHATQIQDGESASARLATLRKKLLDGAAPTPGEWKHYHAAPADKQGQIQQAVHAAGHGELMAKLYADYVAKNPAPASAVPTLTPAAEAPDQPKTPQFDKVQGTLDNIEGQAANALASGDLEHLKKMQASLQHMTPSLIPEAQDGAKKVAGFVAESIATLEAKQAAETGKKTVKPKAADLPPAAKPAPEADDAGKKEAAAKFHADLQAELGQGDGTIPESAPADSQAGKQALVAAMHEAKVADSNTNAKSFNPKVDAIIAALEAGDTKALLAASYGTNTYGKKAAKLANEALALLGSEHQVDVGQKAGQHKVLLLKPKAAAPAPEPAPAAPPAPAAIGLKHGELPHEPEDPDNTFTGTVEELVQAAKKAAIAGDLEAVKAAWNALAVEADTDEPVIYAKKLAELLGSKQAQAEAETVFGPQAAAINQANEPGLSMDEIAAVPKVAGMQDTYADQSKEYAAQGEVVQLKNWVKMVGDIGQAHDAAYAQLMLAALEAKVGGANTLPAPGLTDAELPASPTYALIGAKVKAEKAVKLAVSGDLGALKAYAAELEDNGASTKLTTHVKSLVSALEAKLAGQPLPGAAPSGPQEGETKQGADGMLVFQDGRWHKVATDPKVLKKLAAAVTMPKLSGKHASNMSKIAKALKEVAETQGGAGLKQYVSITEAGQVKINPIQVTAGAMSKSYVPLSLDGGQGANALALASYANALLTAMGDTNGGNLPPTAAAPTATSNAATPGQHVPPPVPPVDMPTVVVATEKVGELTAMVADSWKQTGPQKGSNPGGKFKDTKGVEWYCKFPADQDMVKNELLAAKFYEMLGAKLPTLRLVKKDGKLGIASKWVDGMKSGTPDELAKADGTYKGFVFDAWLANWDAVGADFDNLLLDKQGKALRVDVGGSLAYRAMGGKKGAAFGNDVTELDTLLDPSKNAKSAAVFKDITPEDIKAGAEVLAKMREGQIKKLVNLFGPGDQADKEELVAKLAARRNYILEKAGIKDPWVKVSPDLTALSVDPADLLSPIAFTKSSKEHINKQNTIDDQALFEFAKQGNLQALKDYHYDAYDKETGVYIGKKPITDHPAKDIKEHWAHAVELLQTIAYPSIQGLPMPPLNTAGGTLEEIADAAGSVEFGKTIETISAEKRLGLWMKLAHAGEDFADMAPKKTHWFSSSLTTASKAAYKSLSKITRSYIQQVQASGWINHIYSKGDKTVSLSDPDGGGLAYNGSLGPMVADLYKNAHEMEEGLRLTRWMKIEHHMVDQLLQEKPGLIFQNTNSMCTSFAENWDKSAKFGDGSCLLKIVCAKGSKALHSFASGAFSSEKEITTLPGARFVLMKAEKGTPSNPKGVTLEVLMLPPDENWVQGLPNK